MPAELRDRAAEVVDAVAGRLADPDRVAAVAGAADNTVEGRGAPIPVWYPVSLSDGYPGVSLLFAELGVVDRAHAHLAAASRQRIAAAPLRLFSGAGALAYAAHLGARSYGGYHAVLARLDGEIAAGVRARALADLARIGAGEPIGAADRYDTVSGLTGLGRHLLARYEHTGDTTVADALTAVLELFAAVSTAPDVEVCGQRVPAWWVDDEWLPRQVCLGLAHGVSGPLALLASAWRAGVRVDAHEEAADRLGTLLLRWRGEDADGPYWPMRAGLDDHRDPTLQRPRTREVWCYGGAGVSRALLLAGAAFGRADWLAEAHVALRAAVAAASDTVIHDCALCHGWSGVLQVVTRTAVETGDRDLAAAADALAGEVVDRYDPAAPFGFRHGGSPMAEAAARPGFLDGSAGIALALHTYATWTLPATGWDAALLLT